MDLNENNKNNSNNKSSNNDGMYVYMILNQEKFFLLLRNDEF